MAYVCISRFYVLDNKQLTANTDNCYNKMRLMPSPSADSKFVLSVLKFLGTYTQIFKLYSKHFRFTQMSQFM